MGRPKATLPLEGRTFLERVTTALDEGGCRPVIVVFDPGEPEVAAEARRLAAGGRLDLIENSEPGDGPITSLRLALDRLTPEVDGLAWLPLDHPLVGSADVRRLLDEAASSGASLTLPVHGSKRGHPALFRRSLFAELSDPRREGGARTVVHRNLDGARLVAFDHRAVIEDIDTPEAYARVASPAGDEAGASEPR
jgi:molybdenum cofactor cytidylyltransferase